MTIVGIIPNTFAKCGDFHGCTSRLEYWLFALFAIPVAYVLELGCDHFYDDPRRPLLIRIVASMTFDTLIFLVLFPLLAAGCRRLHDSNRTGLWQVFLFTGVGIPILMLMYLLPPEHDDNEYIQNAPPDPMEEADDDFYAPDIEPEEYENEQKERVKGTLARLKENMALLSRRDKEKLRKENTNVLSRLVNLRKNKVQSQAGGARKKKMTDRFKDRLKNIRSR